MTTILTIAFRAKPERLADFRNLLTQVQRELPGTKGCCDLRILSAEDDPTAITLIESWSSRAAHETHVADLIASGGWEHVASHLAADPVSAYWSEV